jgi:hypothetical protein
MVREPFRFKKVLQDFASPGIKPKVNVSREEFVMNGDSSASFVEEVKESEAILSSGDSYQNSVSLLDQSVTVDCFPH